MATKPRRDWITVALAKTPPDLPEARKLVATLIGAVAKRKTAPRQFSPDDLKKAVFHLAFDMQHFRSYRVLYKDQHLGAFSGGAYQAVRYALLLHLRLLIDFFYSEPVQDDCSITHFHVLPGFTAAFPVSLHAPAADTKEIRTALHKFLVHMTATRWEKNRKDMNRYDDYSVTIDDLITKFEAALPEDVQAIFRRSWKMWEDNHPPKVRPEACASILKEVVSKDRQLAIRPSQARDLANALLSYADRLESGQVNITTAGP